MLSFFVKTVTTENDIIPSGTFHWPESLCALDLPVIWGTFLY